MQLCSFLFPVLAMGGAGIQYRLSFPSGAGCYCIHDSHRPPLEITEMPFLACQQWSIEPRSAGDQRIRLLTSHAQRGPFLGRILAMFWSYPRVLHAGTSASCLTSVLASDCTDTEGWCLPQPRKAKSTTTVSSDGRPPSRIRSPGQLLGLLYFVPSCLQQTTSYPASLIQHATIRRPIWD